MVILSFAWPELSFSNEEEKVSLLLPQIQLGCEYRSTKTVVSKLLNYTSDYLLNPHPYQHPSLPDLFFVKCAPNISIITFHPPLGKSDYVLLC